MIKKIFFSMIASCIMITSSHAMDDFNNNLARFNIQTYAHYVQKACAKKIDYPYCQTIISLLNREPNPLEWLSDDHNHNAIETLLNQDDHNHNAIETLLNQFDTLTRNIFQSTLTSQQKQAEALKIILQMLNDNGLAYKMPEKMSDEELAHRGRPNTLNRFLDANKDLIVDDNQLYLIKFYIIAFGITKAHIMNKSCRDFTLYVSSLDLLIEDKADIVVLAQEIINATKASGDMTKAQNEFALHVFPLNLEDHINENLFDKVREMIFEELSGINTKHILENIGIFRYRIEKSIEDLFDDSSDRENKISKEEFGSNFAYELIRLLEDSHEEPFDDDVLRSYTLFIQEMNNLGKDLAVAEYALKAWNYITDLFNQAKAPLAQPHNAYEILLPDSDTETLRHFFDYNQESIIDTQHRLQLKLFLIIQSHVSVYSSLLIK